MPARPLLWLTVFFMLGISANRLFGETAGAEPLCFVFAASTLLALSTLCRKPRFKTYQFPVASILFLIFGLWAGHASAPPLQPAAGLNDFFDRQYTYVAEVSAPPEYYPDKVRIPLRLLSVISGDGRVFLRAGVLLNVAATNDQEPLSFRVPGDRLLFRAILKPFRSFRNPGGFDYSRYQAEKGFHAQAYLKDANLLVKLAPEPGFHPLSELNSLRGRIDLFRQKALIWFRKTLDPVSAGFYAALILGYQQLLDGKWQDLINMTGLNHLLSVSGLHLGLVSLLVFWLVRRFVRSAIPKALNRVSDKQFAVWPALACAVIYAFMAGFGVAPIWRSVLMLAVCFSAAFWYRSTDSLTVLALTALFILVLDPNSFWQISFQLTFLCVLAVILVYPMFRKLKLAGLHPAIGPDTIPGKILSQFEDAFWLTVAVNLLVLPLTVYYFNGISVAGFAANILLVPYVGFVILPWGLLSLAVFAISEFAAYPFIKIGEWLLSPCLYLIEWFGNLSWSYLWTGSMPIIWFIAIYAGFVILLFPFTRKMKIAGLVALLLLLGGNTAWNIHAGAGNSDLLRVDVIDVGQGTSTLVRFPSGETMLVDGGGFPDSSFDTGRTVVAPFLWHEGIRRVDHVALSHDHPDHRNGLRFILSHFDVGAFWTAKPTGHGGNAKDDPLDLENIAARRHIKIRTFPELSEEVGAGNTRIRVIHPTAKYLEQHRDGDLNDCSAVFEIRFGNTTVILPGDIGQAVEVDLIPRLAKSSQVLLVSPHHGSRYSNSEEFLDALHPRAIVFSCGYGNPFGFPAEAAVRRCAERQIPMYRTDLHGAIHAVSDGLKWTITTEALGGANAQKDQEK
jgi:competence protein ComEC